MRTRLHTVQTKSAIEVAGLARLKQSQFATTLNHHQRGCGGALAANAILGFATCTDTVITHSYFKRRDSGRDKVELTDGTEELAEGCVLEDYVDRKGSEKVSDYE